MTEESKKAETMALAPSAPPRLAYPPQAARYGFDPEAWRVLTEAIFPGAESPASVLLALAYCKARGLDPLKRPVHIVPVWDSKRKRMIETLWPGIGELRTTAARTGQYAGRDDTAFGPDRTETFGPDDDGAKLVDVTYPEWAQVTVYRMIEGKRCAFVGPKVYWKEAYATRKSKSDVPNSMWADRPRGQLDKCAEAASLRAAFPEEIGGDLAAEEIGTRREREYDTVATTPGGAEIQMPRRKGTADAAASPAAAAAATAEALPNPYIGTVETLKEESGQSTDEAGKVRKWTRYVLHLADGRQFSTFSKSHADFVRDAGSLPVSIAWERKVSKKGEEYINVTSIGPAPAPAAEQGQQAEQQTTEASNLAAFEG